MRHLLPLPLPLPLLLLAACAPKSDDATDTDVDTTSDTDAASDTDTTAADTDVEVPATGSVTWSADEANLAAGAYTSWAAGSFTPPSAFEASGQGVDVGAFRPTSSSMPDAEPLAVPADGAQTYWVNTNPFGPEPFPSFGAGSLEVTLVEHAVVGRTYAVTVATGVRLDTDLPDVLVSLEVHKPGALDSMLEYHKPGFDYGTWTPMNFSWTADQDGASLKLVVRVRGTLPHLQQVLIDAIRVSW